MGKNVASSNDSLKNFLKTIEKYINNLPIDDTEKKEALLNLTKIEKYDLTDLKKIIKSNQKEKSYLKLMSAAKMGGIIGGSLNLSISAAASVAAGWTSSAVTTTTGAVAKIAGIFASTSVMTTSVATVGLFFAYRYISNCNRQMESDKNDNYKKAGLFCLYIYELFEKIKKLEWVGKNLVLTSRAYINNTAQTEVEIGINFVYDEQLNINLNNKTYEINNKQKIIMSMAKRSCVLNNCENLTSCIDDLVKFYIHKSKIRKGLIKERGTTLDFNGCSTEEIKRYDEIYDL